MKITLAQLKKLGAREDQVALFLKYFGEEVEATEALCVKHAQKFNWNWAANNLLSAPAQQAYNEAMASAQQAYDEAMASARRACNEATARAFARAATNKGSQP